jgi:hypothetical protein
MDTDLKQPEEQSCPKRLWVLLTLSDDELVDEDGSPPPGLQFHLSRCESCRALAERLRSVSDALRAMSTLEPGEKLAEAANTQALTALRSGAQLTGRVHIPEEPEPVAGAGVGRQRLGRYAAAAVIFIAVGLYGVSFFAGRQGDAVVDKEPTDVGELPAVARIADTPADPAEALDSSDDLAGAGDPDVDGVEERLAEDVSPRKRLIRRHHSHIEAAMSDDPHGAQAAVVLPDTTQRDLGWGRVFDRPRTVRSTKAPKREP